MTTEAEARRARPGREFSASTGKSGSVRTSQRMSTESAISDHPPDQSWLSGFPSMASAASSVTLSRAIPPGNVSAPPPGQSAEDWWSHP